MAADREDLLDQLRRSRFNCDERLLDRVLRAWGFERAPTKKGHFYGHREIRDLVFTTHRAKGPVSPGALAQAIRVIEEVQQREEDE